MRRMDGRATGSGAAKALQNQELQLAFLALFGRFVMFAQHLAVGVGFVDPFLAIVFNNGFIIGAFLFPANNFAAFSLGLSCFLNCSRNIRTTYTFFFVFLLFSLRGNDE